MPVARVERTPDINTPVRTRLSPVLAIIFSIIVLQLLTHGQYGFYRDELEFMSDAQHIDWGFAAWPPAVPFLARVSMSFFGVSLSGLRFFPLLAQSAALFLTALMARELGGGRLAQAAATLGIGFSYSSLANGRYFSYTAFDYLWWVLACYIVIRLLKSENPRWWLALGALEGIGLLTKYTISFLIIGILLGAIFTRVRQYLVSGWFWGGHALALLLWLPNVFWQFHHDFVGISSLQAIHDADTAFNTNDRFLFLVEQVVSCVNLFAVPMCLIGLIGYLRSQRFRMIGWMYIAPFALFIVAKGRSYYLAPAYPMLIAMGAVMAEQWINSLAKNPACRKKVSRREKTRGPSPQIGVSGRRWVAAPFFVCALLWGAYFIAIMLPFQSKGPLRDFALKENLYLMNEFGWNELVQAVARIHGSLPADERAHLGILVGNTAEEGAIGVLGSAYNLPKPISPKGTGRFWGYPTPPPTTLIVVGATSEDASILFRDCTLAAHYRDKEGISSYEITHYPDIFLCGPPRLDWPEFWKLLSK
jgi:4-amino-4-deoxy-L-arabinose transferase-like glycosyltransferase